MALLTNLLTSKNIKWPMALLIANLLTSQHWVACGPTNY